MSSSLVYRRVDCHSRDDVLRSSRTDEEKDSSREVELIDAVGCNSSVLPALST